MDLSITNNRICAAMPGHRLCLDYQLPAVEKIFTLFLKKHPLIPNYKDCHFYKNPYGPLSHIYCSSGSYRVSAQETKWKHFDPKLEITLRDGGTKDFESLECDKNGCHALNNAGINYYFHQYPDGECLESFNYNKINKRVTKTVPCDGDATLFEEYLKHSTVDLEVPQPVPPPQPQYAHTWGSPPHSGNSPSQSPTSFSYSQTGFGAAGNATPQNQTSFSYLQTGLGAASTIYCLYKTYKEMVKIDEEGQRDEEASRLKAKAAGHAGTEDSNNKASGWRALGYLAAAIASGAFTYYSIRA